jgi:exopolyphosphatase/guanosine-5'-triphosphate,3'-diphosphate pyrophosphatase
VGPSHAMTIVPRWEWRAFGASFGAADERFARMSPERVDETDEIYLVSRRSDSSAKVRNGLMDVKRVVQVDDAGLEQWMPAMKAPFPLSAPDAGTVLRALGVPTRAIDGAATVDDLAGASPHLLAVDVHKRREHHRIGGCMAEVTAIRTAAGATRTIAVESEDPALVAAAVHDLGLSSRRVVCVARGLKALAGFGAQRYAVVDVGTNSVKFHVGERSADGEWRTVVDRAAVTRLGEGLERTGRLGAEAIERTVAAIALMADEAEREDADAVAAVGTAGLRVASNAEELVEAVRDRCELTVEVISGEEEARLAYLAARESLGLARGPVVVFDSGGGSTQFTFGDAERVDERFSLNVGAVRLTEQLGLDGVVSENALAAARDAIAAELAPLDGRPVPDALVGMGGAMTNLAAVAHGLGAYDPDVVQGTVLGRDEIDDQIERYRTRTAEERRQIVGLQANRAEVILAGACVVRTVLAALGRDTVTVCDRGLRHGLIVERFGIRPPAPAPPRGSVEATTAAGNR